MKSQKSRIILSAVFTIGIFCFFGCCLKVIEFQPNVPQGGRANSLAVKPNNNDVMLVASETGGLFRTNDGGSTWTHLGSFGNIRVRDVAFALNNPEIVIATTLGRYRIDETGIWRSTDGGTTWSIPIGSKALTSNRCGDIVSAHGIAFSPNSNRLFVGTNCGLAISDDLGNSWRHLQLDATRPVNENKTQNRILSILALDNGRILAAGEDGIWNSQDDGNSWQKSSSGPNWLRGGIIHGLAASPYSSDHIFLAHRSGNQSKLYLSIDGGDTWTEINSFSRGWARPLFVQTVKIGIPLEEQFYRVYFGDGVRVRSLTFKHNANNPINMDDWEIIPENHADPSEFAIHSDGETPLVLATDGGLHKLNPYLFLLKKENGNVHIHQLGSAGTVNSEIQRHDWSSGWTTVTFFETGGNTYLFLLKESDGNVHIHRMNPNGTVGPRTDTRDWSSGWTQAVPFKVDNNPYLFLLKKENGNVHIHQLGSGGTVGSEVKRYDWSSGWTTVTFFEIGGNTYLFLLKESDGNVHIHRMNPDGTVGPRTDTRDWSSGWTQAVPFKVDNNPYLFLLKKENGNVHIHQLGSGGTVGSEVKRYDWSSGWTTVTFFDTGGNTYLFLLKEGDGNVHIHRMNPDGTVGSRTDTRDWTSGWTQAVPFPDGRWQLTGPNGYNALQITEITGQEISGSIPHLDLYYGTQDNLIKASSDAGANWPYSRCCEGFFLRIPPSSVNHELSHLTGVSCGPCSNFISDQHLQNQRSWPNPPDDDEISGDVDGNPFLLPTPGHYIQLAVNNDVVPLVYNFKLTTDYGVNWSTAYSIDPKPVFLPIISGPSDNPYIYQAVERPEYTPDGYKKIGLKKIRGIYSPSGATVVDADVDGLGSIGIFPTMFAWYPVIGVSPFNPEHLLCADVETEEIKFSINGGLSWTVDNELTDCMKEDGTFRFRYKKFPMASATGFDPYARCHILVGTVQNGIFRSTNSGKDWKRIKGSAKVTNISGFYFPSEGPIYVSTYGRGLWELDISRPNPKVCLPLQAVPVIPELPSIHNYLDGTVKPFTWPPSETEWGKRINYIIIKHGLVSDLKFAGDSITGINMAGGFIYQYNWQGKPMDLEIPNNYDPNTKSQEFAAILKKLQKPDDKRSKIRGILITDHQLAGLIVSENDLPIDTGPVPKVEAHTNFSVAGIPLVQLGDTITIYGSGFASSGEKITSMISLNNRIINKDLQIDKSGRFRVKINIDLVHGPQEIIVEQRQGKKLTRVTTTLLFAPRDESVEKEKKM
jgi:hypothetical protein